MSTPVKYGVRIKINVSMILKEWLFAGKKGKYLDATVFLTPNDAGQYGDHGMVTQDVPQSVSQADPTVKQGPILGNCTVFWSEGVQQQPAPTHQPQAPTAPLAPQQTQPSSPSSNSFNDFDDDIPF